MFDWGHVYVFNGILDHEIALCMSAFRSARDNDTTYADMGKYFEGWRFPGKRSVMHLFTNRKIKTFHDNKSFGCTGSELLTMVPVMLRYFKFIVKPRGRMILHVDSLIAGLTVVTMLLAIRTCTVDAGTFKEKVEEHLAKFVALYGPIYVLPKHHYALHLPKMFLRFGILLSTMVNERKHRLALQYTRDRDNGKGFELCALEEITVHQLWELALPFFNCFTTSKPHGRVFHALHELFPGIADHAFTLHRDLKLNGGNASYGDVVSFWYNGVLEFGQLKLAVGIQTAGHPELHAMVAQWESLGMSSDGTLQNFRCRDSCVKVLATSLDTVFTHRLSASADTCSVIIPYEFQRRA